MGSLETFRVLNSPEGNGGRTCSHHPKPPPRVRHRISFPPACCCSHESAFSRSSARQLTWRQDEDERTENGSITREKTGKPTLCFSFPFEEKYINCFRLMYTEVLCANKTIRRKCFLIDSVSRPLTLNYLCLPLADLYYLSLLFLVHYNLSCYLFIHAVLYLLSTVGCREPAKLLLQLFFFPLYLD